MPDPKNTPDQNALGAMFKKARVRAKRSQEEVAKSMGSTQAYISETENGRTNPPFLTLVELFKAVGRKFKYGVG